MDKLRNIDQLLKTSVESTAFDAVVSSDDWLAIEKKLKQRRNRIYAMWFSLALIGLSSIGLLLYPTFNQKQVASEKVAPSVEQTIPQELHTQNDAREENAISSPEAVIEYPTSSTTTYVSISEVDERDIVSPKELDLELDEQLQNRIAPVEELLQAIVEQAQQTVSLIEPLPAQKETKAKQTIKGVTGSHWEIGLSVTPSLANKWTTTNSALAGLINRSYFGVLKSSESAAFAYSSSLQFSYHLPNGLYVGTGLGITQRTEAVNYHYDVVDAPTVDDVQNEITGYLPIPTIRIDHNGSNSYHFIEIPLSIGYALPIGNRLEFRNELSASYMLLTNSLGKKADYTYLTLVDLQEVDYLNKSNVAATLTSGLYFNFKNFVIGAEPSFSMNMTSLTNNQSALEITPYNYGLNITTAIKLNRK